jgi:AraC-like DNA-binding protein
MLEISHKYGLTPEWQFELAEKMGAKLLGDKIIVLPNKLGSGYSYFSQIIPGFSISLHDFVFTTEVIINRQASESDFYILQIDLDDETDSVSNVETVLQTKKNSSSGFSVHNSRVQNYFIPEIGKRLNALHLLIDRKLLDEYLDEEDEGLNNKLKYIGEKILFYNHIDSVNKILIHKLRKKTIFDIDYNSYVKGVSLKILANFIGGYTIYETEKTIASEDEAILRTKEYLLDNLHEKFPSLLFLSKMAGMSITKYKIEFKKKYGISPNQFFIENELIQVRKLLISGKYSSINDVFHLLNYSKTNYFMTKYFNYFGRKPSDDFRGKMDPQHKLMQKQTTSYSY